MMRRDSYRKIGLELLGLLSVMALVAAFGLPRPVPKTPPPLAPVSSPTAKVTVSVSEPPAAPKPVEPPAPILDEKAVAEAEARVKAAKAEASQVEIRLAESTEALKVAQTSAAKATLGYRKLASSVRDTRPRVATARSRGEVLKAERDRLQGELMALNEAPRPRRKALVDKSPVAKLPDGEEFHFEVRGSRVAFIDLERLLDRVKSDARMQIRMSSGNRPVAGVAGPVGSFSIRYEVARLDDGSDPRVGNFGLTGWEIQPESELRGETFAQLMGPASDFTRAINRLNPARDVITLWVYPDAFPLYRQLRDSLHERGFLVAARPLPDSMPIRGSPTGSSSSAQ